MGRRIDFNTDPEFKGEYLKGLETVGEALQEAIDGMVGGSSRGLVEAAVHILSQSAPLAPKDLGTLQGSGYVEIEGSKIAQGLSAQRTGTSPEDATRAKIGFSEKYAATQHEQVFYTHQNGQAKYLESVLEGEKNTILELIAQGAEEGMTNGND